MDKSNCFFIILIIVIVILLTLFGFSLCQILFVLTIGYLYSQFTQNSDENAKKTNMAQPVSQEHEQILNGISPHDLVDNLNHVDDSGDADDHFSAEINEKTGCFADNKIVEMARYRGKQHENAMLGRYSNNAKMAKRLFEAELDAQENSIWWGRDQLECLQRSMQM